jgi:hypothetical protein
MRRRRTGGAAPLSPKRKWQTITVATLLLVPAFWSMLAGLVAYGSDETDEVGDPAAFIAFGFALIPFVFVVLAFMSEHPRAPSAVVKAMGLSLAVGIPVSALAADAVSGIVAGVGAGGLVALRPDPGQTWKPRAIGVAAATMYTFVLVRTAPVLALLPAPIFPLTALGIADQWQDLTALLRPRPARRSP